MEYIYYLLEFVLFCLACGIFFMIVYVIIMQYKDRKRKQRIRENMYNRKYLWLKDIIYSYELHKDNYNFIKTQLIKLGQMEYKNREKTSVLTCEFFRRFARYAKDEVLKND